MLERLRNSLALRLAVLYTGVFALVAAALFAALYWELANALEAREQAAVERLAARLGRTFEIGGASALRLEINSNASPEVRSFFVRVLAPNNQTLFVVVPPDWVQTQVQSLPLDWGITATREVQTVRIPQNALKD